MVGGVFLALLTYNRVQPLSVGNCKAALLWASAACEDSRDERVLGGKSGVGKQGTPLQSLAVLRVASVFAPV